MQTMKEVIQNRSDFEEFIYDEKSHGSFIYKNVFIFFGGGLFYYEEADALRDRNGFEINTIEKRKYCTIEEVRRRLLEKETNGALHEIDSFDENQLIAEIVYLYAV